MDEDEAKLLKEICRRVEAQLSDTGLALSAQWRQAVADSADGAVSIRALLASGLLVGLTDDVEDVAAAVRAHATQLRLTEDGRNVCRLSEEERADAPTLPMTILSEANAPATATEARGPVREDSAASNPRAAQTGTPVEGQRYYGRVYSLLREPFGQYYRRAGFIWLPQAEAHFVEGNFVDDDAVVSYGTPVSCVVRPKQTGHLRHGKDSAQLYLAMDIRIEAEDAVPAFPSSGKYSLDQKTTAEMRSLIEPLPGAAVEGARLLGRVYSLLTSDFYREKRSAGYIWCPDLRSQVFFSEARLKPNVKVSHRIAVSFTLRIERSSSTHGTSKYQAYDVERADNASLPPFDSTPAARDPQAGAKSALPTSSQKPKTSEEAVERTSRSQEDAAAQEPSSLMARLAASQRGAGDTDADAGAETESESGSLFSRLAASQLAAGGQAPSAAPNQGEPSGGGGALRIMRPAAPPVAGERYFGRIRGVLKSSTGNYRRAGFIWSPELDGASLFREGATDKMAAISYGMAVSFTAKAAWNADRGGDKSVKYEAANLQIEPDESVPKLPKNKGGDDSEGAERVVPAAPAVATAPATRSAELPPSTASAAPRSTAAPSAERLRYRNMASEYELPTETHKCTHCGQSFYKVPLLNEHVKVKHPNFDEYKKLLEAERAQQQLEGGQGDAAAKPQVAVTADTLRTALQQAGDGSTEAALLAWLESLRMQDARAQFAAAGLDTLDAVRDLPADKETALVESLKLQLGPKKRLQRALAVLREGMAPSAVPAVDTPSVKATDTVADAATETVAATATETAAATTTETAADAATGSVAEVPTESTESVAEVPTETVAATATESVASVAVAEVPTAVSVEAAETPTAVVVDATESVATEAAEPPTVADKVQEPAAVVAEAVPPPAAVEVDADASASAPTEAAAAAESASE